MPPGYAPTAPKTPQTAAATSPQPAKQQHTKQPTIKAAPVAVQAGDPGWSYRCKECSLGIRDPDFAATVCLHTGCKVKDPMGKAEAGKEESSTGPKSAFSCTFTKASIETEMRIGAAGPDGDLALSKQDQETVVKMKELQEDIASLKDLRLKSLVKDPSSTEFIDFIAGREAQIQKLKKTVPAQEAQQARDTAASMNALA